MLFLKPIKTTTQENGRLEPQVMIMVHNVQSESTLLQKQLQQL